MPDLQDRLLQLQTLLWAESQRALLVVLQAMDGGGKDGTIAHVFRGVNPQGTKVTAFKAPSPLELSHDFLWRAHNAVPAKGEIGIFNRSHYEDVLVVRVEALVPESVWRPRYDAINDFERHLTESGVTVVKLWLHISAEEQRQRFLDRLEQPEKRWKFRQDDIDTRARWDDYQAAAQEMLTKTSTEWAPWHVVPADRKWYRNWAVSEILVGALEAMDPQVPPAPRLDDVIAQLEAQSPKHH
jgi:PPK2 family polyphosphate:nucleotide phosphotransferase